MILQIIIGSTVICVTVILQVFFIAVASRVMSRRGQWLLTPPVIPKVMASLSGCVLWLVLCVGLISWVWALLFLGLNLFETLESSLYFSIVTFTTLGLGDVTLDEQWRLLSGFAAVNGLIVFGLNTAYLVSFLSELNGRPGRADSKQSSGQSE